MHSLLLAFALGGTLAAEPPSTATKYALSADGSRITYDVTGSGPAIMLLNCGGQTRRVWHDASYVARPAADYTVITVDFRGAGESDKPTARSAYAIETLIADLLAVADSAGAPRFTLWGFSYGANIGRYLASRSDRVRAMVYVGVPFGPPTDSVFQRNILELEAKWSPVVAAARAGTLNPDSLPEADRRTWARGMVPVNLAWLTALPGYPSVEPAAMRCPTLWLVGTRNVGAMASVAK